MNQTGIRYSFPELRGSLSAIKWPAFGEIKYDGELERCVKTNGTGFLVNKYGTVRNDSAMITKLSDVLGIQGIMIGELFAYNGHLGELYNLISNKTNEDVLQFMPFDILEYDGKDVTGETLLTRKEILLNACKGKIPYMTPKVLYDKGEALLFFSDMNKCGFEGVVIKNFDETYHNGPCGWVKMKKKDRNDYELMLIDPVKERGEVRVNSLKHQCRNVGVKICNKYKAELKVGDIVTIEHQGILSSGGLRHPVFIGKVVK